MRSRKLSVPSRKQFEPGVPFGVRLRRPPIAVPIGVCSGCVSALELVFEKKSEPGGSEAHPASSDSRPIPRRADRIRFDHVSDMAGSEQTYPRGRFRSVR